MAATVYELASDERPAGTTREWINVKQVVAVFVFFDDTNWRCILIVHEIGQLSASFATQAAAEARAALWVQRIEDAK